ncbi:hypothetical protein C5F47_01185 [Nitrosopumilus cobalaminigenes]|uniref:Uncharacterized protein n=2 Tax=Nitrosopumilus cobalaminigenes TaxID=1470066 RepID=A0A7D5QYD3_9ARCH|nr:hypothetical protein C5F47_01185 [Nitrosopumilus cobalaminigenes]
MMFLFAVSTIPVYAQNVHFDEDEEKIRAEILECEDKIMANDSLTDASKTVEKRECSSEIRKKYAETALTFELQDEMKIRLQNLQKCEDWHSQYQFLDEVNFKIQKNVQMVESCISLYNDPLWTYAGEDRIEILSDKLETILVEVPIKTNPSDDFLKNSQYEVDRIYSLEKKIAELEDELHNKNLIIREQMNVISNLANTLRNAIFDGFQSVYPFV